MKALPFVLALAVSAPAFAAVQPATPSETAAQQDTRADRAETTAAENKRSRYWKTQDAKAHNARTRADMAAEAKTRAAANKESRQDGREELAAERKRSQYWKSHDAQAHAAAVREDRAEAAGAPDTPGGPR